MPSLDARGGDLPFRRIGIVGLGLIGASIGLAARRRWPAIEVAGVDRAETTADAIALGAATTSSGTVRELGGANLIVLATPVNVIVDLLQNARDVGMSALMTDVGSTKRRIMAAAGRNVRFIGGHPMAGAARGGLENARADLFTGCPWLLVPGKTSADDAARLSEFVRGLGADPIVVDAETHDRAVAFVSHLPQLLSVALMTVAGRETGNTGLRIAGPAFRDMTRLAESSPDVWRDIVRSNADFINEALEAFVAALPTSNATADASWIDQAFPAARAWRARLGAQSPTP